MSYPVNFACVDCNVCTGEINEYYMLYDQVWLTANPERSGMLCIGCVEQRLDRELSPDDFLPIALNFEEYNRQSERLRKRLHSHAHV